MAGTLMTMDEVGFQLQEQHFSTGALLTVMPHVNGQALTDLLTYTARPASRASSRRQAGQGLGDALGDGHAGLAAQDVRWPSRHFLGDPVESTFPGGSTRNLSADLSADLGRDTGLLGCSCGIYSCGPFSAIVSADQDVVVWSHFRFAEQDVVFTELRDLVFARGQYEAALRATAEQAGPYRTSRRRR